MRNSNRSFNWVAVSMVTFLAAFMAFGVEAKAYVDPSAATYLIQAVAGVVIVLGTAVGVYWRKARKKVRDKLGLQETKEQETDEIIVKDADAGETEEK